MMNLNEFAKEVHANAVAHGWWDEERSDAEIIALIHSEWSEALEEYRAGRWRTRNACLTSIATAPNVPMDSTHPPPLQISGR